MRLNLLNSIRTTCLCLLFTETSNDTGVQNTVPMSGDQGSNPPDGARQHLLHAVFPGGDFYSDGACVV